MHLIKEYWIIGILFYVLIQDQIDDKFIIISVIAKINLIYKT